MRSALLLGLRLSIGNGNQRARTTITGLASAVGVCVVLLVWGIAVSALGKTMQFQSNPNVTTMLVAGSIGMVALPVIALVATIARLSASVRDRRLANLRLLGLTGGQTRLVAATEVGGASAAGAVIGAMVAAVVAEMGSRLLPSDGGAVHVTLWPPTLAWLAVPFAVAIVAVSAAVLPQRLVSDRALSHVRQRSGDPVRLVRILPLALGFLLCATTRIPWFEGDNGLEMWEVVATMGGIGALGIGMLLVIPVFMSLIANCLLRFGRGPLTTLVGRRLQTQPASATRVIAALMMGLFIVVGARGVMVVFLATPQYVAAADFVERHQTAEVTASPAEVGRTVEDLSAIGGVERVATFAVAQGALPDGAADGGSRVTVVVASCGELATNPTGLPGCSDEAPSLVGGPWFFAPEPDTIRVRPVLHNEAPGHVVEVDMTDASRIETTDFEREFGALAGAPVVVVPPTTPGITALIPDTSRLVVVHAGPGRDLYDRVEAAGYRYNSGVDLENYDFVQGMLTLVWTLAAVIIAIGLATFTIAGIDRAISRRRDLTALRLVGVPHRLLRRAQWLEAALPTVLGSALAIVAGAYAGTTYLQRDDSLNLSASSTLALAAIAMGTSLLLAWVTTLGTAARIEPEHIRSE